MTALEFPQPKVLVCSWVISSYLARAGLTLLKYSSRAIRGLSQTCALALAPEDESWSYAGPRSPFGNRYSKSPPRASTQSVGVCLQRVEDSLTTVLSVRTS
jgi:hypothetical protein